MGIKGLESFLRHLVPNGVKTVNILHEIRKWKGENPGKIPIIIVDLIQFVSTATRINFGALTHGGRNQLLLECVEIFFEKIQSAGVQLIFSYGLYFGEEYKQEIDENYSRDELKCARIYSNIYAQIDRNETVNYNFTEFTALLGLDLESIAAKYGILRIPAIKRYKDILNYVREHDNVLAIISRNTNYLIPNISPTQYWLCGDRYLKLKTFDVVACDIHHLDKYLGLEKLQKALFGAILLTFQTRNLRNVVSSSDKLMDFFSSKNFEETTCTEFRNISLVADYVSANFAENDLSPPDFAKIVGDIFDVEINHALEETLCAYFEKYNMDNTSFDAEATESEFEMYCESANRKHEFVYNVLFHKVICIPSPYFSFINVDKEASFVELILPIFRRNMGIILQHKNDKTIQCKIKTSLYYSSLFPNEYETAIYPEVEVPDLDRLIFHGDSNDADLLEVKWRLFFWCLSIEFNFDKYKQFLSIRDELKPVVLTLLFLRQEEQITTKEADGILITENKYLKGHIEKDISYPKVMNGHTIRLAHFYVQMRRVVNQCFRTCGLAQYAKSLTFDAVFFHIEQERYSVNAVPYQFAVNSIREYRIYES